MVDGYMLDAFVRVDACWVLAGCLLRACCMLAVCFLHAWCILTSVCPCSSSSCTKVALLSLFPSSILSRAIPSRPDTEKYWFCLIEIAKYWFGLIEIAKPYQAKTNQAKPNKINQLIKQLLKLIYH